jgi:hypothetical protein
MRKIIILLVVLVLMPINVSWGQGTSGSDRVMYVDTLIYNGDSLAMITTSFHRWDIPDTIHLDTSGYSRTTRGWVGIFDVGYWEGNGYTADYEMPVVHHILEWIYTADANGDGAVNIGDAVYTIQYVFPRP